MKKSIFMIIIIIVALAAAFVLVLRFFAGQSAEKVPKKTVLGSVLPEGEMPEDKTSGIEQQMSAFSIDGRSAKGANQWRLEGASAEIIGEEIHLYELKAVVYGEEGVVNITSDRGVFIKDKGEVELMGDVVAVSDDGLCLTTERARWSQTTKIISTDDFVTIKRETMTAMGTGGMADSDGQKATLKEDVTVIIEPDMKVTCDGSLDVSYNENKAVFHDNVKVIDKDGDLFADKLTVNFNTETRKMSEVVAEGNVKIKKGNSYTMSDKAIYSDTTASARLIGKPRVIIDLEELDELDSLGEEEKKLI